VSTANLKKVRPALQIDRNSMKIQHNFLCQGSQYLCRTQCLRGALAWGSAHWNANAAGVRNDATKKADMEGTSA
jgi:hypothetical protein